MEIPEFSQENGIKITPAARPLQGVVMVPGDKSLSHRALLFAAMSSGLSHITNLGWCQDIECMWRCLQQLGCQGRLNNGVLTVNGWGDNRCREATLDCGNSGTAMRLLSGMLAAGQGCYRLVGDASLQSRPMKRIAEPLSYMGAGIQLSSGDVAPITITSGKLHAIHWELPVASAQVKSAVLLAGLSAEGCTVVVEPGLSRDHTERILKALGIPIRSVTKVNERSVAITGPASIPAFDIEVPGDCSAAAFWILAAILLPGSHITVENVGINPTRVGFVDILGDMGAELSITQTGTVLGEPVGTIEASSSKLHSTHINANYVPQTIDELTLLVIAACFAEGQTTLSEASELRAKECDRLSAIVEELNRLGGVLRQTDDGVVIDGCGHLPGGQASCHDDHRMEMGLAIAGLASDQGVTLSGIGHSAVSYPEFWNSFLKLQYRLC